tara:strand:- start:194 stop:346 length:153 start_codon:yes stop_codon:yes gene_type:complete
VVCDPVEVAVLAVEVEAVTITEAAAITLLLVEDLTRLEETVQVFIQVVVR